MEMVVTGKEGWFLLIAVPIQIGKAVFMKENELTSACKASCVDM